MTKEKAAEHRTALIAAAAKLLQEGGFDGTGVAEISARAGLTQGALYGQFASKSALAAEACHRSFENGLDAWVDRRGQTGSDAAAYINQYLQPEHIANAGDGCPMAAYASEVSRQEPEVKEVFKNGFIDMVRLMQDALPGDDRKVARKRALLLISALAGSVAMARATEELDPGLSAEIVASAREVLELLTQQDTKAERPSRKQR
ncbi:TetR/AcrR family transcriptional regulator [Lichenicola cladoniae]|uniref:TetR/AcrR family transcriptional regulator n=1 Tax=Lichenicola cladoniae TaxID=1484109 RepID=UPI001EF748F1|nr:TetR/AcrR family transcriptional regulator [Lichenicola cladoniae]